VMTYFVYVSGEDIELAKAEVELLLDYFFVDHEIKWIKRLAKITAKTSPVNCLLNRAALAQFAGIILAESSSVDDFTQLVSHDDWTSHIKEQDSFAIKTLSLDKEARLNQRLQIEKELGTHIRKTTGAKVDLREPSVQILALIDSARILICKSNMSKLRALLRDREPSKKAFFHPSMMNSTLARVMCNLAGIRPDDVVLDPFCGAGGILCEAAYIGSSVVGIDLNWRLLMGAKKNLSKINENYSLIQGDAQKIPIQSVNRIVSDPPYGRASSTRGNVASRLVESLLEMTPSILQSEGECMCLCSDSTMKLSQMVVEAGLVVSRTLNMRVHSGLTREIVVIGI
jgi:tRNA (guanine10-N2)-dimethyltransferase